LSTVHRIVQIENRGQVVPENIATIKKTMVFGSYEFRVQRSMLKSLWFRKIVFWLWRYCRK